MLDAGFYIPSLNGFPRAFVNFALDTIGIEGILKLVEDKERTCEFRQCLVYTDGENSKFFESSAPGTLAKEKRGEMKEYLWSKLGLIFVPKNYNKTLAELTQEEYAQFRQERKKDSAITKFAKWLNESAN